MEEDGYKHRSPSLRSETQRPEKSRILRRILVGSCISVQRDCLSLSLLNLAADRESPSSCVKSLNWEYITVHM